MVNDWTKVSTIRTPSGVKHSTGRPKASLLGRGRQHIVEAAPEMGAQLLEQREGRRRGGLDIQMGVDVVERDHAVGMSQEVPA